MMSTSSEKRVGYLIHQSDLLYNTLLQPTESGERKSREVMRRALAHIAITTSQGMSIEDSGSTLVEHYLAPLFADTDPYWKIHSQSLTAPIEVPNDIAQLANLYSDVQRGTWLPDHTFETDDIHALHVAGFALPYTEQLNLPDIHLGKLAIYIIVHDIVESYAGDTITLGASESVLADKKKREADALQEIETHYGERWPAFVGIIHDYENLVDTEAMLGKTLDKFDPGFTHFTNRGAALRHHDIYDATRFLQDSNQTTVRMQPYASNFPIVMEDRQTFIRRIVQHVFFSEESIIAR